MAEAMTKALLLKHMRSAHETLAAALAGLPANEMERPRTSDGWSIKDLLFHIAWWEGHMAGWVEEALLGREPAAPAPGMSWDDIDRLNEQTYREGRVTPLPVALAMLGEAQRRSQVVVEAAPEEALLEPGYYLWREGVPLWNMVAANTYWHYAEHAGQITVSAGQ